MTKEYDVLAVPADYTVVDGECLMTIAQCEAHLQLLFESCRSLCSRATQPPIGMLPNHIEYRIARCLSDRTKCSAQTTDPMLDEHVMDLSETTLRDSHSEQGDADRCVTVGSVTPVSQTMDPSRRPTAVLLNGAPISISTPPPENQIDAGCKDSDRIQVQVGDQVVQHVRTRNHLIVTDSSSKIDQITPGMYIDMIESVKQSIEILDDGGVCLTADLFSGLDSGDTDPE
jgi:hypothetical protein